MTDTPCGATNKNSICILAPEHDGRHFDARNGHSWAQTAPEPEQVQSNDDADHKARCCAIHGCKYATTQQQENDCPVSNGTLLQNAPCEFCQWSEDALRQASDEQLANELIRRGYLEAAVQIQ